MYTDYSSQNIYQDDNNSNNDDRGNKAFSFIWKILLVFVILILLFIFLINFGVISLNSSVSPTAVILNVNEVGVKKGNGYQLVTTVMPENANNKQVVYESSDPSVATVNPVTGYIKALKNGVTVITVKTLIDDKESQCVVTVGEQNVLVDSVTVNEKNISLAVGYSHTLSYKTSPPTATELNLNFSSSDTSVATVDSSGVIRGIKAGTAIITIYNNSGVSDTSYVTVYKKGESTVVQGEPVRTTNYPRSVNISNTSLNLTIGSTGQLSATIVPIDATNQLSWSSSNNSVATVDQNGLVSANGIGSADIIVKTVNNLTAICHVTVGNYSLRVRKIYITTNYTFLQIGVRKQLFVAFEPSNATNRTITWSSSNPSVATVNSSGVVEAISSGNATITAKAADGGYTDSVIVDVASSSESVVEVRSLSFSKNSYSVGLGSTKTLTPIFNPTNATYKTVSFRSDNPNVATVDENGVVKGISVGSATITAETKRGNVTASVKINVKNIASTSVTLNTTNVSLGINQTYTLTGTVKPDNASNKTVTFTSDNPNVATVDKNGIIRGVSKGTTTITVTPNGGGSSSTCLVTVN